MKKIYRNKKLLFVFVVTIVFSLSTTGQTFKEFTTFPEIKTKSHLLDLRKGPWDFEGQPEVTLPIYKSTQGPVPQTIHSFYWDVTTIWMAHNIKKVSYDANGKRLNEVFINANTMDTTSRNVYFYDEMGRPSQTIIQLWNNGSWLNDTRSLQTYDPHGNIEVWLYQNWWGNNWVTSSGNKFVYSYDENANITQIIYQSWNSNTTSWQNNYKEIFIYNLNGFLVEVVFQYWHNNQVWISLDKMILTIDGAGVVLEVLYQMWNSQSSSWENEDKIVSIVWHVWDGLLGNSQVKSYTALTWNNGIWENDYRVNTDFDNLGGFVEIMQEYSNGNWVNWMRYTYLYDTHGNFVESTDDYWNGSIWVTNWGQKDLLTYTGNDLTQRITQYFNNANMLWENNWKEQYSDFIYVQNVPSHSTDQASLLIYPNPSDGVFYLELSQMDFEFLTLQVLNINGQVMHIRQISESDLSSHKVDLSNLAKGVYFLHLQNNSEFKAGKVIIR